MLKVGVTGGIGAGKTTVCQVFEELGVPIYNADRRAKEIMEEDEALIVEIKNEFGAAAYLSDGTLDRQYIARIVFEQEDKLLKLNDMVHPAVHRDSQSWNEILARKGYPFAIRESALIVETSLYLQLDKLIVVSAPMEDRINRVVARDGASREQVIARINAQMPQEEKEKYGDYIIYNDALMELVPQVTKIYMDLSNIN
jgi:dephospho-CoA kinase